jgi:hypothetical protein
MPAPRGEDLARLWLLAGIAGAQAWCSTKLAAPLAAEADQ